MERAVTVAADVVIQVAAGTKAAEDLLKFIIENSSASGSTGMGITPLAAASSTSSSSSSSSSRAQAFEHDIEGPELHAHAHYPASGRVANSGGIAESKGYIM